eukprot:663375-Amphidinium_carterae.1
MKPCQLNSSRRLSSAVQYCGTGSFSEQVAGLIMSQQQWHSSASQASARRQKTLTETLPITLCYALIL